MKTNENNYEVIIVGGSYSGLAAGLALGRALRKVLVIDNGQPCNQQTPYSHNFLTQDGKTPQEISSVAKSQVALYHTVKFLDAKVTSAMKTKQGFEVRIQNGKVFSSKKLVFATGIKDLLPDILGFAECWGISVLHCPYCHGYEVRHQKTGILANGDSGFELAILLTNWTSELILFTNGPSTFSETQNKVLQKHQIIIIEEKIDCFIHQNGYLQGVGLTNNSQIALNVLYSRPTFLQQSNIPELLGAELTSEGYIKVDAAHKTSIPGLYACGDNVTKIRTIANAIAMGTTTGLMLNKEWIEHESIY